MIWLKQKVCNTLTFGFSVSSTSQPVTVLEALSYSIGKTHEAPLSARCSQ